MPEFEALQKDVSKHEAEIASLQTKVIDMEAQVLRQDKRTAYLKAQQLKNKKFFSRFQRLYGKLSETLKEQGKKIDDFGAKQTKLDVSFTEFKDSLTFYKVVLKLLPVIGVISALASLYSAIWGSKK